MFAKLKVRKTKRAKTLSFCAFEIFDFESFSTPKIFGFYMSENS